MVKPTGYVEAERMRLWEKRDRLLTDAQNRLLDAMDAERELAKLVPHAMDGQWEEGHATGVQQAIDHLIRMWKGMR